MSKPAKTGISPAASTLSTSARALAAAGDAQAASEIGALDAALGSVEKKLAPVRRGLVERLIYGPAPSTEELQAGGRESARLERAPHATLQVAVDLMRRGNAFTPEGKLSETLRAEVARAGAYGLTVPVEFGGQGASYLQLASLEEALAANGLGPLAVELSGQLTIGAGALLGYGSTSQRQQFLPLISAGTLIAFALTEVGTGVNAKKIQAYVEVDEEGTYRLFADGARNKLWITSATHGALAGIVARIGREGSELGLFVVRLPEHNVQGPQVEWEFRCDPSNVAAFTANINSRLHFRNFPIPPANRIPGDGVEVLFYCLRLGRCMLAAMSAGYQRMLARDAINYARQRPGVGGLVGKHEMPRLAIGKMLGGSLQARALSFLALSQDAQGADLAGLRDLTKSAAAQTGLESMHACEHVMGGRAFAQGSRVNAARANLHLFGVVEGEDDMIRLGMVRDVTLAFVDRHLSPLLGVLQSANMDPRGGSVAEHERMLRLGMRELLRFPRRGIRALFQIATHGGTYRLLAWVVGNAFADLVKLPMRLVPAGRLSRYRPLPPMLREQARFAENGLRRLRWTYLRLSFRFQLELTVAQLPLQRLGQRIEWLVSMLALCHHSASQAVDQQHIARLQCLLLREKLRGAAAQIDGRGIDRLRDALRPLGQRIAGDSFDFLQDVPPEPFAHDWGKGGPS